MCELVSYPGLIFTNDTSPVHLTYSWGPPILLLSPALYHDVRDRSAHRSFCRSALYSREYHPSARLLPTVACKRLPEQEKHLCLLDAIALLLVSEEKSDVAAVMFEQTTEEVVFYYSKNRPTTSQEREYLEQLRQLALTIPDITECTIQLLNHVIPMCRNKIVSRLRRLKKCIPSDLWISEHRSGTLRSPLVEKMPHLFPETSILSCENIVLSYLSQVCTTDNAKCSVLTLRKLIRFAFAIGSYQPLGNLIQDETIVWRVRKIGNYYSSAKGIATTVSRFRQPNAPGYTTANVTFCEVGSPRYVLELPLTVSTTGPTTQANDHLHLH